ncbi:MAG: hypothetical protein ACLUVG_04160 [Phocaeicola vulgatus]
MRVKVWHFWSRRTTVTDKRSLTGSAFQARELGLENMGCYAYTSDNIADVSRQAMQSGAEYVICIPSEIEEMKPMLEAHKAQSLNGRSVPRMLFSDTAYGADVLKIHGDAAEGIEESHLVPTLSRGLT